MKQKYNSKTKLLSFFILVNLLYNSETLRASGIVVDSNADKRYQANITETRNKIDQVDIVAPSSSGTSHNKFLDYNVSEKGVILNNSAKEITTTLGGIISKNNNLNGREADLIITEVTGNKLSNILGYTEIAGKKADYILANPNGINVNGAGFLNTRDVTLTTGSILNDPLLKFKIRKGLIEVGEKGVNTEGVDYFSLISKTVKISGAISSANKKNPKEVKIIAGSNDFNYATKEATGILNEAEENLVGIDTGELGGIIANKITLISNDKGVGVNVKSPLVAEVEDITIDSMGNITLKSAKADKNINLKADKNIITEKALSGNNIYLSAKNEISNSGIIYGNELVKTNSKSVKNKKSGEILSKNTLNITSEESIENTGTIQGENEVDIIGSSLKNIGKILAKTLNLDFEKNNFNFEGEIFSTEKTTVNSNKITFSKDLQNEGSLELNGAKEIILPKNILSKNNINIKATNLDNSENISITSGKDLDINIKNSLINSGDIKAYKDLKINTNGNNIKNMGKILAQGDLDLKGKDISTDKDTLIYAGNNMSLEGNNLYNSFGGTLLTLRGDLNLYFKEDIRNGANEVSSGLIKSGKDLNIKAKNLYNESKKYQNSNIGNYYTDIDYIKNISENSSKLSKAPELNYTRESIAGQGGYYGGSGKTNFYLSNWNSMKGSELFDIPSGFEEIKTEHSNNADINYRYYNLYSTFKFKNQENMRGSRFKQGIIESDRNMNINLEKNLENGGIINSNNNIKIIAKNIKNITDITRINSVIDSFKTLQKAKITASAATGLWITPTPKVKEYYKNGEIIEVVTKDILIPSETVARISANGNLEIEGGKLLNVDTENNIISEKEYESFKRNENTEERKEFLENILKNNSTEKFLEKLNELQETVFDKKKEVELNSIKEKIKFDLEKIKELNKKLIDVTSEKDKEKLKKELTDLNRKIEENKKVIDKLVDSKLEVEENKENISKIEKDKLEEKKLSELEVKKINEKLLTKDYIDIYTGNSGLFKVNNNKNRPLIETNIEFISLEKFYASDYFFKKIGYSPEKSQRQLGDAYYETNLINKVAISNFGNLIKKENLNESLFMKSLLDNAVDESKLNSDLKIGKPLTEKDIQKLTKNIVWYVEMEVNGERVLAPQLYIAKTGLKNFQNNQGSTISGENIKIDGDFIRNAGGNIIAENKLDINSGLIENISNASKGILEGKETYITSVGDILNKGGTIKGDKRNILNSSSGNVINETTKEKIASSISGLYKEEIKHIGKIQSKGLVSISGEKDFIQRGGITQGENVNVSVQGDIKLEALDLREKTLEKGGYEIELKNSKGSLGTDYVSKVDKTDHIESIISSDKNTNLESNKQIILSGAIISGENNFIVGKDGVHTKVIKNIEDKEYSSESKEFFYNETYKENTHKESVVKNQINSKNALLIKSNKDINLNGVDRNSGGLTYIDSKDGKVNEEAVELVNTSEIVHHKFGGQQALDEKSISKVINGKIGFDGKPGVQSDVDSVLNNGFVTKELLSKYGATGSITVGFTTSDKKESVKEITYDNNKISAGEQFIQGKLGVTRKGFNEKIQGDSYIKSSEGNVEISSVENKTEKTLKENKFSLGMEYGYKIPILSLVENLGKRIENSINSEYSAFNAEKNGKESIGKGAELGLRALETLGDLTKINSGTDIANVYTKFGITNSSVDKNMSTTKEVDNTSVVGGKSSYTSKNLVSIKGLQGETGDLDIVAKDFELLSNKEKTVKKEHGESYTVDIEMNAGVDKDGPNAGVQLEFENSIVDSKLHENNNKLSKLKVKNKVDLTIDRNATIEGLIEGEEVEGRVGKSLSITSIQDTLYSTTHNVNSNVSAGIAISSNGVTPTGSFGGTYGLNQEKKSWVKEQAGIIAKKGLDLKTKVINLTGGLLGSLSKNSTKISSDEINVIDLKDSHDKSEFYAGGGAGFGKRGISSVNAKVGVGEGFSKKQDTNSTIGTGEVLTNSSLEKVNTDFEKSQVKTKDFVIGKFDIDVTKNKKIKPKKSSSEELVGKTKIDSEEHIYEEIKIKKPETIYDEVNVNRIKPNSEESVTKDNPSYESTGKTKSDSEKLINEATKYKIDRLENELSEIKNEKLDLEEKINRFISTDKKILKEKNKIDKLEEKRDKLLNNPTKNRNKIEKLESEIISLKEKLQTNVKDKNPVLASKFKELESKDESLKISLEKLKKENIVHFDSEVELSKNNYNVLESQEVYNELKKQYKNKLGIDIEAQGIKPEDTSVVKLEKKSLNKMVYEITENERESLKERISSIPKQYSENISKDIADSVILSSKTLTKDIELQGKVQTVVEEFLKSKDKLTVESLAKLNKDIRVEEIDENKQIFKTDHLTKEGAVFTDPLVSKQYLENFVQWYNKTSDSQELDGLEKAALTYQRLMTYHPFSEGNGRVTRVLVNKILLENGYSSLPKFSDELTKKVLPQSSEKVGESSYTAKEFVESFINEIKSNTKSNNIDNIALLNSNNNNNNNNNNKLSLKEEYKKLFQEAKEKYKNRDSNEEALKKLDILTKNVKNIPKEHLVKALEELNFGLNMDDLTALQKEARNTNKKVLKPDTIEEIDSKGQKNIAKIYNQLDFDKKYMETRESINSTIYNKLVSNPEFNSLMNSKLSGDRDKIEKLFYIVENAKHESLKEITGISGERATVKIDEKAGPLKMGQGYYDEKNSEVNMNIVPLASFLRSKKNNNKEILDTIIHELTHHDQNQFVKNRGKNRIDESISTDVSLFTTNQIHYMPGKLTNIKNYKNQPLEREAFASGHDLSKKLSKYLDEQNKKTDITIEHIPEKNKNLENKFESNSNLGELPLIYGTKLGRKELTNVANKSENKENVFYADSYIGKLNLGIGFSNLKEFAEKVRDGKITEAEIDEISKYNNKLLEGSDSPSTSKINYANTEDNKRLLTGLLKNETAVEALRKIANISSEQGLLEENLKKYDQIDLDNPKTSKSLPDNVNEMINKYHDNAAKLDDSFMDFFAEKTKLVAKENLDKGGKIYMALDGIVTTNRKGDNIDFDRLKDAFDTKSPYYNSVTSKEIRFLYENYKENPNVKFTIKKQVIENPFNVHENLKNISLNPATEHKINRIKDEILEMEDKRAQLDEKINSYIQKDKKLLKEKKKIDKLLESNKDIESQKKNFLEKLEKKSSALTNELKSLEEQNAKLKEDLENITKNNLLFLDSEVELSKKNYEVLNSNEVQNSLKEQFKKKFGVEIDPKDTSVIKLEKKALNKMVYETTLAEREELKRKIETIPKQYSENISKDIADSVILSSKTLSKNEELQTKVQNVVDEFLKSNDKMTIESLAKLNKDIRVEELDESKQIFKTDHLTKEGAVFTDPLVSKQYLENFVQWYNKTEASKELDGLEKAALAYQRLMTYHPFAEGNGRVTRVIVNKILLENGYRPLPKFSDELTKKVLPQSSEKSDEGSYTAREFINAFVEEIKNNSK